MHTSGTTRAPGRPEAAEPVLPQVQVFQGEHWPISVRRVRQMHSAMPRRLGHHEGNQRGEMMSVRTTISANRRNREHHPGNDRRKGGEDLRGRLQREGFPDELPGQGRPAWCRCLARANRCSLSLSRRRRAPSSSVSARRPGTESCTSSRSETSWGSAGPMAMASRSKWKGKNIYFIAGGIGMAPVRSVMNYVLDNKKTMASYI